MVGSLTLTAVTSGLTLAMRETSVKRFHTEGKASKSMAAMARKKRGKSVSVNDPV